MRATNSQPAYTTYEALRPAVDNSRMGRSCGLQKLEQQQSSSLSSETREGESAQREGESAQMTHLQPKPESSRSHPEKSIVKTPELVSYISQESTDTQLSCRQLSFWL
ncbi:Hypothetical predicted protein, partial [Pelobates cultripes]